MTAILRAYKETLGERKFAWSFVVAFLLLIISLFINYFAGMYATERASNAVTDLILSNTPVFDVDAIFVYGSFIFWIGTSLLLLRDPKLIPFALKSIALFVIIRSFFISLTHIGPFPQHIAFDSNFIFAKLAFGGDLFFSGHTGLPQENGAQNEKHHVQPQLSSHCEEVYAQKMANASAD